MKFPLTLFYSLIITINCVFSYNNTNKVETNSQSRLIPIVDYYCLPNYNNCSGSHNLFVGCVRSWDKILLNRRVRKEGRWWSSRETIIKYPEDYSYVNNYYNLKTITGIRIYDKYCNNQGGYAAIISGGVGFKNATLRFYSTGWGKGFDFLLQLYGS